jgi:hypothetical protein
MQSDILHSIEMLVIHNKKKYSAAVNAACQGNLAEYRIR